MLSVEYKCVRTYVYTDFVQSNQLDIFPDLLSWYRQKSRFALE